ncbi:MAG: hypothetical protein RLZZ117_836 [Cyanobacteriota bacterium]|jgi:hypothetical protein
MTRLCCMPTGREDGRSPTRVGTGSLLSSSSSRRDSDWPGVLPDQRPCHRLWRIGSRLAMAERQARPARTRPVRGRSVAATAAFSTFPIRAFLFATSLLLVLLGKPATGLPLVLWSDRLGHDSWRRGLIENDLQLIGPCGVWSGGKAPGTLDCAFSHMSFAAAKQARRAEAIGSVSACWCFTSTTATHAG